MTSGQKIAVEMTVVESPKAGLPTNLGNRCAIPTFPPLDDCYIFFKTYPERSLPHRLHLLPVQAHSSIRKEFWLP